MLKVFKAMKFVDIIINIFFFFFKHISLRKVKKIRLEEKEFAVVIKSGKVTLVSKNEKDEILDIAIFKELLYNYYRNKKVGVIVLYGRYYYIEAIHDNIYRKDLIFGITRPYHLYSLQLRHLS